MNKGGNITALLHHPTKQALKRLYFEFSDIVALFTIKTI